ncbi:MAG: hypothetical protein WDM76_14570 [Limisphaerales bacterium]
MRHFVYIIVIVLTGAAIGFAILGLQGRMSRKPPLELFPDMDRQARLRPQEPNPFFTNCISSQLPPAGTIARSTPIETANGEVYSFEDSPVNTGHLTGTTNFIETNPVADDDAIDSTRTRAIRYLLRAMPRKTGRRQRHHEKNWRHARRHQFARQTHR